MGQAPRATTPVAPRAGSHPAITDPAHTGAPAGEAVHEARTPVSDAFRTQAQIDGERTHMPVAAVMRDVTVQFRRWTMFGNTAYQKGEYAGVLPDVAQRLVASGNALFAHMPGQRAMITK